MESSTSTSTSFHILVETVDDKKYTFSVEPEMTVLEFKKLFAKAEERPIEDAHNIVLYSRGKVLDNVQLLSEYNLESGCTL